mgnify:CR=1 FL=1
MEEELNNQIKVLEARVNKLEKEENKRKAKRIIKILIKIAIIAVVIIFLWKGYNNYVKPYIKVIDEIKENYESFGSDRRDVGNICADVFFHFDDILGKLLDLAVIRDRLAEHGAGNVAAVQNGVDLGHELRLHFLGSSGIIAVNADENGV